MAIEAATGVRGRAEWRYGFASPIVDYGFMPALLPPDSYSVLAGVDGREDGVLRRYRGHRRHTALPAPDNDVYLDLLEPIEVMQRITEDGAAEILQGFLWAGRHMTTNNIHMGLYLRRAGQTAWLRYAWNTNLSVSGAEGPLTVPLPEPTSLRLSIYGSNIYVVSTTSDFKITIGVTGWTATDLLVDVDRMGPIVGKEIPLPTLAWSHNSPTSGRSRSGRNYVKLQFYDERRMRRSAYTNEVEVTFGGADEYRAIFYCYYPNDGSQDNSYQYLLDNYTHVEVYATISTEDIAVPAGGYYRYLGAVRLRDPLNDPEYVTPTVETVNYTRSVFYCALWNTEDQELKTTFDRLFATDAFLATQRFIDPVMDEPGAPPQFTALAEQNGVTFGLSPIVDTEGNSASFCEIQWGIGHRPEKETFPAYNRQPTRLRSDHDAVFVSVGNGLVLFGDGEYYRIRKNGDGSVGIWRLGENLPVCSRRSIVAAKDTVYLVSPNGAYELDGITGSLVHIQALDRLIHERWVTDYDAISLGYDGALDAVFIHNSARHETVVLWRSTSRITQLSDMPFAEVSTTKVDAQLRAIFRSDTTYTGARTYLPRLRTDGGNHTNYGDLVDPGPCPVLDVASPYFTCRLNTAITEDEAFAYIGGYGWRVTAGQPPKRFRIGACVRDSVDHTILRVLVIDQPATLVLPEGSAEWVVFSPVPLEVVGAPLDRPERRVRLTERVRIDEVQAVVFESPGATTPPYFTEVSPFQMGVVSLAEIRTPTVGWASYPVATTRVYSSPVMFADADPVMIRTPVVASGYVVFPVLRCVLPNWDIELGEIIVGGSIPRSGPNTAPLSGSA